MISIKQYLEQPLAEPPPEPEQPPEPALIEQVQQQQARAAQTQKTGSNGRGEEEPRLLLPMAVAAYRSALVEMGNCGLDACPALGEELKQGLCRLGDGLCAEISSEAVEKTETGVREQLQNWGRRTAQHYQQKTSEVKNILLVLAHTAESVGERDQRCAWQITEVTTRLRGIANLEDLTEIRGAIEKSASDLKTSIDQLRSQVSTYQARLEEAEEIASRDRLTGLRSRLWVEGQIEQSLHAGAPFCIAIIDIDKFKRVNDEHGHLAGDELLKKFAAKMRSVCRDTDTIGRWGGDEFILLLHCRIIEAQTQIDRLREWVCGNYTVQGSSGPQKLRVGASIGFAERQPGETMKALIDRADAEMYRDKAASKANKSNRER